MLFSTPLFVFLFLPVVLAVYFVVRPKFRNPWLLLASLFFYAWGEKLLVAVMLLTIVSNWAFGFWIERDKRRKGRFAITFAIAFDLGLLIVFKYADWIWNTIGAFLVALGWRTEPFEPLGSSLPEDSAWRTILLTPEGHIRLPIGVSFFTFQALSYVIDLYRDVVPLQRSLLLFATYKSLFPQLIAGPIIRYKDIAEQLVDRVVTREGFALGVRRFVIGLAKKMLIANIVAKGCDSIFALPVDEIQAPLAWLGIVCYTLQIYFDFSGYSDMAIGLAHMFGFTFLENFDYPYISRSITEFWRRWHISLSTWFRDYLYIPLGGNRVRPARTYVNLLTVFVLCGLWHGASFTFLVWGLFHGAFLVIERAFLGRALQRVPSAVRHVYALFTVMIGWVFFRSETLTHALAYLGAMFGGSTAGPDLHPFALYCDSLLATVIVCGVFGSAPWVRAVRAWRDRQEIAGRIAPAAAMEIAGLAAIALLFFASALELAGRSYNPFIYFRF